MLLTNILLLLGSTPDPNMGELTTLNRPPSQYLGLYLIPRWGIYIARAALHQISETSMSPQGQGSRINTVAIQITQATQNPSG